MAWLQPLLLASQVFASAALLCRRAHPAILAYLAVSTLRTWFLYGLAPSQPEYRDRFLSSLPWLMATQFAAVAFTLRASLRTLPHYGTASCWIFGPAALVAATAAVLFLPWRFGALGQAQVGLSVILGSVSAVMWFWFRLLNRGHAGHLFLLVHFGAMAIANVMLFAGLRPANWLIPASSIAANLILVSPAGWWEVRYTPEFGASSLSLRSQASRAWGAISDLIRR
jgi:hypothetical protein